MRWYFTFGVGHPTYGKHFVCIEGSNSTARSKMFEHFGNNWAFDYSEDDWIYKRGTSNWNRAVHAKIIPDRIDKDLSITEITQAQLFNLIELVI